MQPNELKTWLKRERRALSESCLPWNVYKDQRSMSYFLEHFNLPDGSYDALTLSVEEREALIVLFENLKSASELVGVLKRSCAEPPKLKLIKSS